MKKIIKLAESELTRIIKRVVKENDNNLVFLKRRITSDDNLRKMTDLIMERLDYVDVCEHDYDDFLVEVIGDVSMVFVSSFDHLDELEGQDYDELVSFCYVFIEDLFGEKLRTMYDESLEFCD